tara:strand:- start:52 stop:285 length:234 start_codon:yes stop_codon:yes gene_type:complete
MDEIILTWGQTINGFTKQMIQDATGNVYNIKDRILNLKQRLELVNDPVQIAKIERNLKCLEMSKESIIYYYGLNIVV